MRCSFSSIPRVQPGTRQNNALTLAGQGETVFWTSYFVSSVGVGLGVAVGETGLLCGVTRIGAVAVGTGGWTLLGLSATIRLKAILITTMMLSMTEKIC